MMVVKMKKLIRILSVGLMVLAPLFVVSVAQGAPSISMNLSPSSGSVTNGNNITLSIFENSGTEPVNAAAVRLNYPASLLDYVSISNSSAFNIVATSTGGGGTVSIDRGANPSVTGNQLIATVTFHAKATGTANLTFDTSSSGSKVVSANDNQNYLTSATGGSYTISAPVSPPPPPPSPTPSPSPSPTPSPSPSPSSPKKSSGSGTTTSPSPSPTPTSPSAPGRDTAPPTISNVAVSDIGISSATITWTTSEPATTQLLYGLSENYNLAAGDNNFVTAHKVTLNTNLLAPGTDFHFIVKSADPSGNTASGSDQLFTTKGATLVVTVIDQHKKPVAQAKVTFNKSMGVTDKNGHATLTNLPIGKQVGTVNYKGKQTIASIVIKPIDPSASPQTVTLSIKKSNNHVWFILIPLLLLAVILAAVAKSKGGGGDTGIKDLRGLIAGSGKDAPPKSNTSATTPTPPAANTPAGPTVVRPTIPPRS
jgi:hypothetical protein